MSQPTQLHRSMPSKSVSLPARREADEPVQFTYMQIGSERVETKTDLRRPPPKPRVPAIYRPHVAKLRDPVPQYSWRYLGDTDGVLGHCWAHVDYGDPHAAERFGRIAKEHRYLKIRRVRGDSRMQVRAEEQRLTTATVSEEQSDGRSAVSEEERGRDDLLMRYNDKLVPLKPSQLAPSSV